jgi:Zn finger protein HypA/HybF involved in hydrogenase expression
VSIFPTMERCTKCRFLFESSTPDGIEDCPQCEGTTVVLVESIEAEFDPALPPPTLKFTTLLP